MSSKKKLFAIIAAVAMLAGMLAFGAVPALAATSAGSNSQATVTSSMTTPFSLGQIAVGGIPTSLFKGNNASGVGGTDTFYVQLSSGFSYSGAQTLSVPADEPNSTNLNGISGSVTGVSVSSSIYKFTVTSQGTDDGVFTFTPLATQSAPPSGAVTAKLWDSAGSLAQTSVTIGQVVGGSATFTCGSPKTIAQGGTGAIATITITENSKDAISANDTANNPAETGGTITLTLPSGFTWANSGTVGATIVQGFDGSGSYTDSSGTVHNYNDAVYVSAPTTNSQGLSQLNVTIDNTSETQSGMAQLALQVESSPTCATGNVVATVGGTNTGINATTLTVATIGTYGATVSASGNPTVFSGRAGASIGSIVVTESIPGSLVAGNRTITMTLPSGASWNGIPVPSITNGGGLAITTPAAPISGTNGTEISYTVTAVNTSSTAAVITFQSGSVNVDPAVAAGALSVSVGGSSGASGTATIATVSSPITVKAASQPDVIIGQTGQAAGDLTVTENAAGALMATPADAKGNTVSGVLNLVLPSGVTWTNTPTVKVTSGDLVLNTAGITTSSGTLEIPIQTGSSTASTITVSNAQLTLDRTVPVGPVSVKAQGTAVNMGAIEPGTLNAYTGFLNSTVAKADLATVTTPAPGSSGGSASFTIGATVYTVNGVQTVMDVAPFISNGRTYVPVRYLANALGVPDSGIAWDATTRTVTITSGSNTIVLTIGSTTETVNGTAQTMDVAPQIVNGRTMLPARYVAEALGYTVGWNPVTQEVLISK